MLNNNLAVGFIISFNRAAIVFGAVLSSVVATLYLLCKVKRLDSGARLIYNLPMIEKMIRIGRLYDVYGELLTERQRKCLDLHYLQDLSLGEIAAELGVSRQAINDILHRTEELLEQYEEKLKLLEQDENRTELLMVVQSALSEAIAAKHPSEKAIQRALAAVDQILK